MKLEKFKAKNNKRIGIIVFTIVCILLVSGVILYRTFAIFEVRTNQNVIKGTVQDPGNIYFAFYIDNEIQRDMPQRDSGYILDEEASYCGVTGENDSNIKVSLTEDWKIVVSGVTTSRTKCILKFVKGAYILGKPIKAETNNDGLYETPHGDEVTDTTNDNGFQQTEYRYTGQNPNNYITFNDETWRMIGLMNVMTSETEVKQRVKIIKDESIGTFAWDSNNVNNWTKASLMTYLNTIYYEDLKDTEKNMIDKKVFWNIQSVNAWAWNYYQIYNLERAQIEEPFLWSDKNTIGATYNGIALMYPSDYAYAIDAKRNDCLQKSIVTDEYLELNCQHTMLNQNIMYDQPCILILMSKL